MGIHQTVALAASPQHIAAEDDFATLDRLQIFRQVPPGHGVIAMHEHGCPLIRYGEVAVYDAEWRRHSDITPGLYCYENQRPVACSPLRDSWRQVERAIVRVRRSTRNTTTEGCWDYTKMASCIRRGERLFAGWEGPCDPRAFWDQLIGRVVGIYRPEELH